jgi:hypothetical protein
VKATKGRAAEVQSAAKAQENDSAPGVQPEAPSRAIRTYREARGNTLMTHSATTATAPSTPTDQHLTCEQVCDLPMGELLARVNGSLDSTLIDEPKFLGYVTITASGRITVYTPASLGDDTRDAAIRFLITQHLDLPVHLFPDVFEVTRFTIPIGVQA